MKLYLGTDPSHTENLIHYPVIRIVAREILPHIWDDFPDYTHILFTSKNSVSLFFQKLSSSIHDKQIIAIGQSTAARLRTYGMEPDFIAVEESQEGVIAVLKLQDLSDAYILYPRSSLARKNLEHFFIQRSIRHQICDLYDTHLQKPEPIPDLSEVDEIIFTSPTTVRGFLAVFGQIPRDKKLTCIGKVTEEELRKY